MSFVRSDATEVQSRGRIRQGPVHGTGAAYGRPFVPPEAIWAPSRPNSVLNARGRSSIIMLLTHGLRALGKTVLFSILAQWHIRERAAADGREETLNAPPRSRGRPRSQSPADDGAERRRLCGGPRLRRRGGPLSRRYRAL